MCLRKFSDSNCQYIPEDQTLHFIKEGEQYTLFAYEDKRLIDLVSPCQPIDHGESFQSYMIENVSLTTELRRDTETKAGCGYSNPAEEWWSEFLDLDDTNASEVELQ